MIGPRLIGFRREGLTVPAHRVGLAWWGGDVEINGGEQLQCHGSGGALKVGSIATFTAQADLPRLVEVDSS